MRSTHACGLLFASVIAAALAPAQAMAQTTLYKLIGKDGRVTYVQEAPKDFDGTVIKLEIDTNRNTATGRQPSPPPTKNEAIIRRGTAADTAWLDQLNAARAKLEAARKAYESARDNPGPNEVRRLGKVGGGTRPVFTEEYQAKLERLEAEVKQAQAEVDKLERGR